MSWTASVQDHDTTEQESEGVSYEDFQFSPPFDALHAEPKSQALAAIEAVNKLLDLGMLGPDGTHVTIRINGHAEPDFEVAYNRTGNLVGITLHSIQPRNLAPVNEGNDA